MRAEIEKVVVAWALLFGFTLFSMSFEIFFCNLNFWILTPASEITLQFFSGTPFRSWTFWTYIAIKYELYQNMGPLRSRLQSPPPLICRGRMVCCLLPWDSGDARQWFWDLWIQEKQNSLHNSRNDFFWKQTSWQH